MSTYDHRKILSDYGNGRMKVETAMGHSLQHIAKLYEVLNTANTSRQALRNTLKRLEDELKTLQAEINHLQRWQTKIDRLQTLENTLTALNLTVYQMKDDVDSLKVRLPNDDEGEPFAKN